VVLDLAFTELIELKNKYGNLIKEQREQIVESWIELLKQKYPDVEETVNLINLIGLSRGYLQRIEAFIARETNEVSLLADHGFKSYLDEQIEYYVKNKMPAYIPSAYFLSLKEVMWNLLNDNFSDNPSLLLTALDLNNSFIEPLAHVSCRSFVEYRENMIKEQAKAIDELSTPVIQLWDGILALPLIGTIDSVRAKQIMENLLSEIVKSKSSQVVIDITGVPIVDTGVASRLMRTVEAARLLGAQCILTGISPIIAQTLVTVGVNLGSIKTRATLKNGLESALKNLNMKVTLNGNGEAK
jgi:Anti-anti-sigma regulatory factor (antagonist of anti-sigma factor)